MVTYCVKCKSKTETINPKYKMSKNQKPMVQGKCVKCSKMKSQFISAAEAKKAVLFLRCLRFSELLERYLDSRQGHQQLLQP